MRQWVQSKAEGQEAEGKKKAEGEAGGQVKP